MLYSFLTGPVLWLAFLVFFGGLAWRAVQYVRGLDWRLERVAYSHGGNLGTKGALWSVFKWLVPFGTHSWRQQPYMTLAFFFFHIAVVILPLFLAGHMVVMDQRFGFSFPAMPMFLSDILAFLGLFGALMLILRRLALPEVRFLTDWKDWTVLLLVTFVLLTGVLARFQACGYEGWLILHVLSGELVLFMAPFTKLSHIALFFASRAQIGMDYAIKRGGKTRGAAYPW